MEAVVIVLFLLTAVVISGAVAHALPIPVPVPLVQIACGALLVAVENFQILLYPELFFILFLPPLLFLDGWRISKQALSKDKWLILALAFGLVFVTILGGGLLINWLLPAVPLPICFAFAAILSPTDPIAVSAITEKLPLPKRLMDILEGEALLNDASGLVSMKLAVAVALTGYFSASEAVALLIWSSIAGLFAGILVTYIMTYLVIFWSSRFGEEAGTPILVSLLTPFAAYFLGDLIGASGILAAVGAGFAVTYAEGITAVDSSVRIKRGVIWDAVQSTANGTIFILLGQQLPYIIQRVAIPDGVNNYLYFSWLIFCVIIIFVVLMLCRFIWLFILLQLRWFNLTLVNKNISTLLKFNSIASLAGVRGTITLAGVLTLPFVLNDGLPLADRDLIIFLAAGVIILSLIVATFALPILLANSNFTIEGSNEAQLEQAARIAATEAAILAVEKSVQNWANLKHGRGDLYNIASLRVIESYKQKHDDLLAASDQKQDVNLILQYEKKIRVIGLKAERKMYFQLYKNKKISEESMDNFLREVDLQEAKVTKMSNI
ncbi:Na+/H+ antiporter [Bartonella sp. DGB1]|uniref:Na+/H+ antiporter n=1 Tax=Bartonella sp. DGB1 TaxID=3239807 RepID=UPI0035249D93